ncbi:MAG: hypothetical protein RLZZ574_2590 [Cyanobacteriota bacterium]|jgi:hypothetical protein
MCNIDRRAEAQILAMGLNLITKAIEASVKENNPIQSTDVLATATTAYRAGKITKSQFMAVINALDEPEWVKNGTKPPTHPMVARLIRDAQLLQQ